MTILDHRGRPLEFRDPSAATRHVVYQTPGQRMVANWDATVAVERGYGGTPYLARALQVRAGALAGLPIRAGVDPERTAQLPGEKVEHNPKSPILRFLRANRQVSLYWLVTWAMLQRDVTGRYAFELELDRAGYPVAAWPLVSAYLDPIPTQQGREFWERFEYRVTNDPARVRHLKAEQVHYDWRPSLLDWRQPESLLQSMRLNISVLLATDLHNFAFLNNGGAPSHLVIHEEFAEKADEDKFRNQWKSEYTGPGNAGRAMFVSAEGEGGAKGAVDVLPLGISQRDARAVEIYEQEIRAISVGTGVPMSKLGDASGRTYANAGQEDRNFWEMMVDLGVELAAGINRELAHRFGPETVWFDFSEVAALDPRRSLWRQKMLDDGPRATVTALPAPAAPTSVPSDVAPAAQDRAGQPDARRTGGPAPVTVGDRAPDAPEAEVDQDVEQLALPVDDQAQAEERARVEGERRARAYRATDRQLATLEAQWARSWRAYFARQAEGTLDRLTNQRRAKPVRDALAAREVRELAPNLARIFDVTAWTRDALDFLVGLFQTTATTATARMADKFERDVDLDDRVARFIEERAAWLAETVNTTTAEQISGQLIEGAEQGEGIDKLAARVRGVFDEASQSRAEAIASAVVVGAYNYAADAAADQLGPDVVGGKEWIATRPFPPDPAARTGPDHADADGQVVRIGQRFRVGEGRVAFPGDPSAPADQVLRCRCAVAFLTPEEMEGRAAGRRVELRAAVAVLELAAGGLLTDVRRAAEVAAA